MTLSDLAALADEKVPGFERPDGLRCATCDAQGGYFDDSPAALLMAVALHGALLIEVHPAYVGCLGPGREDSEEEHHDGTPESIARAALVAILRAHGVEVADER